MAINLARAKSLFLAASDFTDAQERAAFLNRECGGQVDLRGRVEALLRANDAAPLPKFEPSDDTAAFANAEPAPALLEPATDKQTVDLPGKDQHAGTVIAGRFKLVEPIGEGGMGSVWRAQQSEPVKRFVAVKLIKAGMESRQVLARFEAERQALAMMDHPNIAKVLDGGLHDHRPYFVMELVKGVPITDYCDHHKLTPKVRLELFVPVCQAIQHAHQKGIIHRDIKPSNVLIALYDDKPVVKVIDFGVAKATAGALTEQTLDTGFGGVVGTPSYMSPEQATFNNLDIDTRSDVYSLGVLLYELLTGSPPFARKELEKKGLLEMLRVVREEEPPRPSTKLSTAEALPTLSANRGTEPKKLTGLLRNELDWVVMKALEKDRTRRYETANAFAADVLRYLSGEAVLAHPPSAGYRLKKFVRRHRGQVGAASLVLFALLAGIVGTTWGLIQARQSAEAERLAKVEAQDEKAKAEEEKQRAVIFRDQALEALRATTGEDVEKLIGAKTELSRNERDYLEAIAIRWQGFAKESGSDLESRVYRAEGHFRVGGLWHRLGRREEARAEYRSALKMQEKLVEECPAEPSHQQRLANTHNNLAMLHKDFGELVEALTKYQAARDLKVKLVEQFPGTPAFQHEVALTRYNLAMLLDDLGKREEARIEFQSACNLQKKLVEQFPDLPVYREHLARIHNGQGILLKELRQYADARAEYQAAHELWKKLVGQFPDLPQHQHDMAGTHTNMGALLADRGKREEAQEEYRSALILNKELVEQYPGMPRYQDYLARNHTNLGNLLASLGKKEEAWTEYRAGRDLLKKLVEQFPSVPEYSRKLATIHDSLGTLQTNLKKWEEARSNFLIAIDLKLKLAGQFSADSESQITLGGCYCNYAILFLREGKPAESLEWFDRAIQSLQPVLGKNPRDLRAREFMRNCYWGRAQACGFLNKNVEKLKDWDRVVEYSPPEEQSKMRAMRAPMRIRLGMVAEAVADVSAATESEKWIAAQWYDFACIYSVASGKVADKKQEYTDRAMELLHNAVKAGYKDAAHMRSDTDFDPLREREDFKKLLAELEKQNLPKAKP